MTLAEEARASDDAEFKRLSGLYPGRVIRIKSRLHGGIVSEVGPDTDLSLPAIKGWELPPNV